MNRLKKLAEVYRQYFLNVRYIEAGLHGVNGIRHIISKDSLLISRPGEDWSLSVEDEGNYFGAALCESLAGEALWEFCFRDDDALLGIVGSLQTQVMRMIDSLPGIITP
jgi:hypothetical protein